MNDATFYLPIASISYEKRECTLRILHGIRNTGSSAKSSGFRRISRFPGLLHPTLIIFLRETVSDALTIDDFELMGHFVYTHPGSEYL